MEVEAICKWHPLAILELTQTLIQVADPGQWNPPPPPFCIAPCALQCTVLSWTVLLFTDYFQLWRWWDGGISLAAQVAEIAEYGRITGIFHPLLVWPRDPLFKFLDQPLRSFSSLLRVSLTSSIIIGLVLLVFRAVPGSVHGLHLLWISRRISHVHLAHFENIRSGGIRHWCW